MTPMDPSLAEQFLLDQFPLRHRALIPGVLRTARAAAATIAKSEPMLQVESAKDNHGRLISWAVDFGVEKLIQSGRWPVDYRWRWFEHRTGRYLEVRFSHSVMSISQVNDPTIQPRDVKFRQNARLNNQRSFNFQGLNDARSSWGVPAFLLVHGKAVWRELGKEFAHVGVPHPDHKRDWIYRTRNLMDMVQIVESDLPPVEETGMDAAMSIKEIKEEIERWRRDNGGD